MPVPTNPDSLFHRLGGREALLPLLRGFYADVRQHELIGPIFNRRIQDWPTHLEKIADFWTTATGGPVSYVGPMPQKHLSLGLDETHFEAWLELWRRHCRIRFEPALAGAMIELAEGLGGRIHQLIARRRRLEAEDPVA